MEHTKINARVLVLAANESIFKALISHMDREHNKFHGVFDYRAIHKIRGLKFDILVVEESAKSLKNYKLIARQAVSRLKRGAQIVHIKYEDTLNGAEQRLNSSK